VGSHRVFTSLREEDISGSVRKKDPEFPITYNGMERMAKNHQKLIKGPSVSSRRRS
jgi:hypothetical protein